jgi:hypothetical protein
MRFLGGKRQKKNEAIDKSLHLWALQQYLYLKIGDLLAMCRLSADPLKPADPSTPLRFGRDDKLSPALIRGGITVHCDSHPQNKGALS